MKYSLAFICSFTWLLGESQIPDSIRFDWKNSGNEPFTYLTKNINVSDFGFNNTGTIDNSIALQNLINAHTSDSQLIIFFPAGMYKFSRTIYLKSKITIEGHGATKTKFIFDNSGTGNLFEISAPQSNAYFAVKGGLKIHTNLLICDSTLIKNSFYELLVDGTGLATSSWAMNSIGQIFKVDSVASNTAFISSELKLSYDKLNNPRIRKIKPLVEVHFKYFSIERLDKTSGQTNNFNFMYSANCSVVGVESNKSNMSHLTFSKSYRNWVSDCYFHHAFDYGGGGKAYGVELSFSASNCLVENNIFNNLRHSVLLQSGANGNVISGNYSLNPFWTEAILPPNSAGELVLHGNYVFANLFEGNEIGNIVVDNSHGLNGPGNVFYRNKAILWGIFMNSGAGNSTHFIGNENTGDLNIFSGAGNFIAYNYTTGADTSGFKNAVLPKSLYTNSTPQWWPKQKSYPLIGLLRSKVNSHIPSNYRFAYDSLRALNSSHPVFISNFKPSIKKINALYSFELESKVQVNVVNLVLEKYMDLPTGWQSLSPDRSSRFLFQNEIIKESILLTNETHCYRWRANGLQNQEWLSDTFCVNNTSAAINSSLLPPSFAYPNPFANEFTISLIKPSIVKLYSIHGELLLTKTIYPNNKSVDGLNLPIGCYVLEIYDGAKYNRQILQKK